MNPLISIIMPSFNSAHFIGEAIQSVLDQSLSDWELIIVDDCSTDHSVEVIQSFVDRDLRIRLICLLNNSGAAVARNKAINIATGRYIAFLDSDDMWLSNKLSEQVRFMQDNDIYFSYSAYEKVNELGHVIGTVSIPDVVSYVDLLKVNSIGCLTAIYDSEKLGKVYMPIIRKRQDLGLWLRILKKVPCAYATPGVLAKYKVRKDSISANKLVAAQYTWKLYREFENLSFVKSLYYFSHYAINGFLRTSFLRLEGILGVMK